jgi:hypothetical protein
LIDQEERSIAERRNKQTTELFDFENYHPYEAVSNFFPDTIPSSQQNILTKMLIDRLLHGSKR